MKMEPQSANQDLQSLLLMPVQRVPRYRLLLESLLKVTDADHGDHEHLKVAIKKISECASYQNDKIAESNSRMKVAQIAARLKMPDLVQPYRMLIAEGELTIRSGIKTRPVYVYLFTDVMIIQKQGKLLKRNLVRVYSLVGAQILDTSAEDGNVIALLCDHDRQYTFVFGESAAERARRQRWQKDFEKAVKQAQNSTIVTPRLHRGFSLLSPRPSPLSARRRSKSLQSQFSTLLRSGSSRLGKFLGKGHSRSSKSSNSLRSPPPP